MVIDESYESSDVDESSEIANGDYAKMMGILAAIQEVL